MSAITAKVVFDINGEISTHKVCNRLTNEEIVATHVTNQADDFGYVVYRALGRAYDAGNFFSEEESRVVGRWKIER